MESFLKAFAPTVASALLGPLGGTVISGIGSILGLSEPTKQTIADAFSAGQLTPEQLSQIKQLEMQLKAEEKERNFRYAELEFKDRQGARDANVAGGIQGWLFIMSVILLILTIGSEMVVLFRGYPPGIPEIVVGRVLGLMDSVAMMVLAYYYGTSAGSSQKTALLAQAQPIGK